METDAHRRGRAGCVGHPIAGLRPHRRTAARWCGGRFERWRRRELNPRKIPAVAKWAGDDQLPLDASVIVEPACRPSTSGLRSAASCAPDGAPLTAGRSGAFSRPRSSRGRTVREDQHRWRQTTRGTLPAPSSGLPHETLASSCARYRIAIEQLGPDLVLANARSLVKGAATPAFAFARVCPVDGACVVACVRFQQPTKGLSTGKSWLLRATSGSRVDTAVGATKEASRRARRVSVRR